MLEDTKVYKTMTNKLFYDNIFNSHWHWIHELVYTLKKKYLIRKDKIQMIAIRSYYKNESHHIKHMIYIY